eukprot:10508445-Alexandrium_andersonii.AAC.1
MGRLGTPQQARWQGRGAELTDNSPSNLAQDLPTRGRRAWAAWAPQRALGQGRGAERTDECLLSASAYWIATHV